MSNEYSISLLKSWATTKSSVSNLEDILSWVKKVNKTTKVKIEQTTLSKMKGWEYNEKDGEIKNSKGAFFSIKGIKEGDISQPIVIQSEVGLLGIVAKYFDGVLHFLMQAKIEPGNINGVQISPTVQATKSNYTRAHGGKTPAYLEYFNGQKNVTVLYKRTQSEQASRFFKKKNENILVLTNDDVQVFPNFKWMTLGQIKELMYLRNLVNMDTRTVISGFPIDFSDFSETELNTAKSFINNEYLFNSLLGDKTLFDNQIAKLAAYRNEFKNKCKIVPLTELENWIIDEKGVHHKNFYHFEINYFDITIHGREVNNWMQPMCKAKGPATFVLVEKIEDGKMQFLIKIKHEIGCENIAEFGPSIQLEYGNKLDDNDVTGAYILKSINDGCHKIKSTLLSEEGGRFYHEENKNIILMINENELTNIQKEYSWVDYQTLYRLIREGGYANIQLRNLFALLDLKEGL